jgi:hypothetical protein
MTMKGRDMLENCLVQKAMHKTRVALKEDVISRGPQDRCHLMSEPKPGLFQILLAVYPTRPIAGDRHIAPQCLSNPYSLGR